LLLNACPSYEVQNEGSYSRLAQQFLRVSTTQLQPVYAILGKTWLTGTRDLPKPPEVAAVSENPLFKPSAQRHDSFESWLRRIHVSDVQIIPRRLLSDTDGVLARSKHTS